MILFLDMVLFEVDYLLYEMFDWIDVVYVVGVLEGMVVLLVGILIYVFGIFYYLGWGFI